jgi:hypothetical protein
MAMAPWRLVPDPSIAAVRDCTAQAQPAWPRPAPMESPLPEINMALAAAWILAGLGAGHTLVSLVLFRKPIWEAVREGAFGRFRRGMPRRLAFWCTIFGPLLVLVGHLAIRAAASADLALLQVIGIYLLIVSTMGAIALPKTPFWAVLIVSAIFIGAGFGWFA